MNFLNFKIQKCTTCLAVDVNFHACHQKIVLNWYNFHPIQLSPDKLAIKSVFNHFSKQKLAAWYPKKQKKIDAGKKQLKN